MTQGMTPAIQIASFVIANDWGRGKAFGRPLKTALSPLVQITAKPGQAHQLR